MFLAPHRVTRWTLRAAIGAACLGAPIALANPSEFEDFRDVSMEDLLAQVQTTASRYEQSVGDAPVALTVVTREDIEASGATSIPEVLRDVVGLDVMVATALTSDVSARGLNELSANSTLVLIDGRSVYADFYGVTYWEMLPVTLLEVESIEVVRGPGSAFYGANAFAGVINIKTTPPDELDGTRLAVVNSTYDDTELSVVHGGRQNDLSWRASLSRESGRDWEFDATEESIDRVNVVANWHAGPDTRLSVSGGRSRGDLDFRPSSVSLRLDGSSSYLRGDVAWKNLEFRYFWNGWDLRTEPIEVENEIEIDDLRAHTHDFDLRFAHALGDQHFVQLGAGYRHRSNAWTLQSEQFSQDLWSAFAYDEYRPFDHVLLSLGVRADDHPLVGTHVAPRGGIVLRPSERHAVRASYGVAYRDPSYLENYWYTEVAAMQGLSQVLHGDKELASEELRSWELGYRGVPLESLNVTVDLFQNSVENQITLDVLQYFASPPAPFPGIPSELGFVNRDDATIRGVETSFDHRTFDWLRTRANYTYVYGSNDDTGEWVGTTPRHKALLRFTLSPTEVHSVDLRARYRSRTQISMASLTNSGITSTETKPRTIVDVLWRVQPRSVRVDAVLGLENVFDTRYRDHVLAIRQERRFVATLSTQF